MRLAINAIDGSRAPRPNVVGNQEVYLFIPMAVIVINQFRKTVNFTISRFFLALFNYRVFQSLMNRVDRKMLPFSLQLISIKPDKVNEYISTPRLT
jgi:hypothetical protein